MDTTPNRSGKGSARLCRISIVQLGLCVCILVACQSTAPSAPPPSSAFQVDLGDSVCDGDYLESFVGTFENRSPEPIEIPGVCRFSAYRRISGWQSVPLVIRYDDDPACREPFTLAAGETRQLRTVWADLRCGETYMIGFPIRVLSTTAGVDSPVYKLYSDPFDVGDAPEGLVGELHSHQFTFRLPSSRVVVENTSPRGSTWIVPPCARSLVEETAAWNASGFYPHATLERLTDWGAWEIVPPDYGRCSEEMEPTMVVHQSRRTMDLWAGVDFDVDQLEPGWYRWNAVYYHEKPELEHFWPRPYSRFSEVFQIQE